MKNLKSLFFLSALALVWACGFAQAATRTSSQTGNWSSTSTWGGSAVPGSADLAVIANGHTVTYDVTTSTVDGVTINAGGTLEFTTGTSRTLQSTKNVEVQGTLKMRPSSASVVHTLRFTGVSESGFQGGGNVVLASDVGLWVMGAGVLDAVGSPKTGWARASGAIAAGATSVTLGTTPSGWAVGDEIAITPTEAPTFTTTGKLKPELWTHFSDKTLTSVSGATVGWSGDLSWAHPMVNGQWTAEVMNLTRNVRIEGTATGRTHVFISSTAVQTIKHTQIRYVGPRTSDNLDLILGRYGIHFHMCGDISGSLVEGMVIRNTGNRTYVPHLSHGITFKDCIGYDLTEHAVWWDDAPSDATHDIVFDGCIMAKIGFGRSKFGTHGFVLQQGDRNVIKNCVAVGGTAGNSSGGFTWPTGPDEVWTFNENNISHNNRGNGLWIWQNSPNDHFVENFVSYHNGNFGILHGSYSNHYIYRNGTCYGNGAGAIDAHAVPKNFKPILFENMILDGAGISDAVIVVTKHTNDNSDLIPTIFLNCTIQGQKTGGTAAVHLLGEDPNTPDIIDFIDCTIDANEFWLESTLYSPSLIRVQNGSTAFELRQKDQSGTLIPAWNARKTDISPFYP